MSPRETKTARISMGNAEQKERGAILLIVLVLIFAVTLAVMAYLYLNKNNTLIASNLAVQNAAQEATDVGLQNAAAWLQNHNPRISPPVGYFASMSDVPSNYGAVSQISSVPVAPGPGFWSSCQSNNACFTLPNNVQYGPFAFQVRWIIFPNPGIAVPLNGYQISGENAANAIFYTVYVHAQKAGGNGGLGVTVQSVVRVVQ